MRRLSSRFWPCVYFSATILQKRAKKSRCCYTAAFHLSPHRIPYLRSRWSPAPLVCMRLDAVSSWIDGMHGTRSRPRVSFAELADEVEFSDQDGLDPDLDDEEYEPSTPVKRVGEKRKFKTSPKCQFREEWKNEHTWLAADPDDPTHALCKVCGKQIRAHKGDIEKHQKTKRHLKKQTTSDILADLIPISCENLDGTKNSEVDHNDSRVVANAGQVSDGQQIIYFTESAVDTQQNTNTVIDKLVEKYHQKRIENLKSEHEATNELNREQLGILKQQLESEAQLNDNKNTMAREEHDLRLKFLQREHEAKLKAIEDERDARLRAIEQELMYARQEYEKKMRLLDVQLSSMK